MIRGARAAAEALKGERNKAFANELGPRVTAGTKDPADLAKELERLFEIERKLLKQQRRGQTAAGGAGGAGGLQIERKP